jgi:hypothetical protein
VAKLARCHDDPVSGTGVDEEQVCRCAVVGMSIKKMEVLKSHLETYREVWDGGSREVKGTGRGGGDRICVEWRRQWKVGGND